jgi:hypothetical protein
MAFLSAGIGLGKPKPRSDSNDQETRNLQEGLLQIGTQAWHILVHANNNNISTYEDDDKNKHSDCITSLVEVAAITQPKEAKSSKVKVSTLLLYFYHLCTGYLQLCV